MGEMQALWAAGMAIFGLMSLLWLISLAIKDASIVDIFWGAGFVLAAWVYFSLTPEGFLPRKLLSAGLVSVWGLRLSLHIARRNLGKGEDYRYQNWRRQHGASWWYVSLFQVFLLQGALMWLISLPLLAAQTGAQGLNWLDGLGLLAWLVGFGFEAIGDWQLSQFRADPANKGKLFTGGLWRYTRHPNYFGDAAVWWGLGLMALAAGGWWSLLSPVVMTILLVRVSGASLLEEKLRVSKPGYAEYIATTSGFLPWLPKKPVK
jgi:steroid 5-alpha reductase family enzyme